MHLHAALSRSASMGLLVLAAACGDDAIDGQGGGAGATTSDAASSGAGTSTSASSATSATSASGSTESGSESGPVGTVGSGGAGGEGGEDGAGGGGGGGGETVGSGGAGGSCAEQPDPYEVGDDTNDACADFLGDPEAPSFHVEFIGEPTDVLEYDGTIALDMAFNYVLALRLADLGDFTLTESRCQLLAGDEEPTCSEGAIDISELEDACSVRYSGRFGIDPSGVREGINTFDFTMTLRNGCAEVADTFTLVVDYQPEG